MMGWKTRRGGSTDAGGAECGVNEVDGDNIVG